MGRSNCDGSKRTECILFSEYSLIVLVKTFKVHISYTNKMIFQFIVFTLKSAISGAKQKPTWKCALTYAHQVWIEWNLTIIFTLRKRFGTMEQCNIYNNKSLNEKLDALCSVKRPFPLHFNSCNSNSEFLNFSQTFYLLLLVALYC